MDDQTLFDQAEPALDIFDEIWQPVAWWAERGPDVSAVHEMGETWGFARLDREVRAFADFFQGLGVVAGDRVLFLAENGFALATGVLACSRIGAWVIPLNARLTALEVDKIRSHASPRVIVFTTRVSPDAKLHSSRLGARHDPALSVLGATVLVDQEVRDPEPDEPEPQNRVAAMLYTTGTTGDPKGVMLTNGNLLFNAARSSATRKVRPGDRAYGVLPLTHVYGLAAVYLGTLYRGGGVDMVARFDPNAASLALAKEGVTIFMGVPAMYQRLLERAELRGEPLAAPNLRYTSIGGAPVDLDLKRRIETVTGIPLINGYGLTETSPTVCVARMDDPRPDDTVGVVVPGVEIKVVSDSGDEMLAGEIGELMVRGPLVMKGYYRDPGRTAEVIGPDGWLRTGDLARVDADGYIYIVGRLKELIIRSGFNVYPPEVEAVLSSHPNVALAAVIGRSVGGNEEVVAFVQPLESKRVTEDDLRDFIADKLAPYKRPSLYQFRDELPAAASGKILKHRLGQELE